MYEANNVCGTDSELASNQAAQLRMDCDVMVVLA